MYIKIAILVVLLLLLLIYVWHNEPIEKSYEERPIQIPIPRRRFLPVFNLVIRRVVPRPPEILSVEEPIVQLPTVNRSKPEQFFQDLTTRKEAHNNDNNNVHDAIIRKDLTAKLLRIIELNGDETPIKMSDVEYITNVYNMVMHEIKQLTPENLKPAVDLALNKISNGYIIQMANGVLYREDYILNHVWRRINSDDNKANAEDLKNALINNLADCTYKKSTSIPVPENPENDNLDIGDIVNPLTTHCINGRVGRVIQSLVILDADPILSAPERDEAEIANEAYTKSSRLIDIAIGEQSAELQQLFAKDKDTLSPEDKEKVENLENHIKEKISTTLTNDYKDLIEESKLSEIIRKAHIGVG
jgi:hypothetical protein